MLLVNTPSMLIAHDRLATATQAVTETPHTDATPLLDRQSTADADVHAVAACELPPTLPVPLRSAPPKLDPSSVTLALPVAAEFTATVLLANTLSCVKAIVTHAREGTTVATHARMIPLPLLALQRTEE
jgi:hypothetical protein